MWISSKYLLYILFCVEIFIYFSFHFQIWIINAQYSILLEIFFKFSSAILQLYCYYNNNTLIIQGALRRKVDILKGDSIVSIFMNMYLILRNFRGISEVVWIWRILLPCTIRGSFSVCVPLPPNLRVSCSLNLAYRIAIISVGRCLFSLSLL